MGLSCCRHRVIHLSLLNFTALLLNQSSNLVRSPWTGALHSCISIACMHFTPQSGNVLGKQSCIVMEKNMEHSQKQPMPWLFDAWVFQKNRSSARVCLIGVAQGNLVGSLEEQLSVLLVSAAVLYVNVYYFHFCVLIVALDAVLSVQYPPIPKYHSW